MPPASTYRVQLSPGFTLDDLAGLADYLAALGAGAVYTSPLLQAAPGSTHGYDVVDPTRVSAALGGEMARRHAVDRLRALGLGLVVDIVPNHMGIAVPWANPWWWSVLRDGPASPYGRFFDVDWDAGPLLVPVLADDGDGGAAALGDLRLSGDCLAYFEHRFPLAPGTLGGGVAAVHQRQHYRLVSWRRATTELNYRRFFDITSLAGVRVEEPEVFHATHRELLRWVAAGEVHGLRVDHPDGLADPGGYLRRLRAAAPGAWVVVEKILAVGEGLPASWPADGTTGYDALREVCGLFVDPAGEPALTALAERWCGPQDVRALERDCRRLVVREALWAEVRRIARLLPDFPADRAEPAVAELLCAFPVYRSYLPEGRGHLDAALRLARGANPELADVLDAIAARLGAEPTGPLAVRLQQTSGMVMAKGVEDTAMYRFPRFVALNEVGGDPARFGVPPEEFHAAAAAREAGWPATMTALSTHDTKRSEDVRARLAVLAELPDDFAALVEAGAAGHPLPDPTLELLAWQTLAGAWPIGADRLVGYLIKAAREAKLRTAWTRQDPAFEGAVRDWARAVLADPPAELAALVERITPPGWSNSLGQKLVQLASPGVPDVYQGAELWDFSLVDPDNRRPVDFDRRRALLARLDGGWLPEVDATGAAKLLVTSRVLRLRRDAPELFRGYRPLAADGPAAAHAVAFARDPRLVAVATRLPVGLARGGGWRDTTLSLPGSAWTDALTGTVHSGHTLAVADVLHRYPVALLVRSAQC
ncbi:malto-oligosyltrehalose synthase [Gandjariella thermophila]|uniref:Malto-oligosyltrehalose synthase n=1 Tax=Gandjariella thermophila TaxID=1931992 RepID=A0A4D4JBP5_9PSEU|nr:malto-oligosyltrehalose synthase [Gandjariella thermophila]GDY32088.1 malto-oligosyltrehalose synthase [Gandjariella thermophila]